MDAFYKVHISFLLNEYKHYIFKRLKQLKYYNTETLISSLFPLIDFNWPYLFLSINLSFE